MTNKLTLIRFLSVLVPIFGLISCSEENPGEPDAWPGPKIQVVRPGSEAAKPLDSTTETLLPEDEIWVLRPNVDETTLAAGDPSVSVIQVETDCTSEARGAQSFRQEVSGRSHLVILDLIPPTSLPSVNPAPQTERALKCEFRLRFYNARGSSRTRRIGPVLVDLQLPQNQIALTGFDRTFQNHPLIEVGERKALLTLPSSGQVFLRCSLDYANSTNENSGYFVSEVLESLSQGGGTIAAPIRSPSPRQFCRIYHRDSQLRTTASPTFVLDAIEPKLDVEAVADLATQLVEHYSFDLRLITLTLSNPTSGEVSYRMPKFENITWVKYVLYNGYNHYASYDRQARARTEFSTAGLSNMWVNSQYQYFTLSPGSQVKIQMSATVDYVCGASNEFVGMDFHPPIVRDRRLVIERAAAPILPGQEESFLTTLAQVPQVQGATITDNPAKRLNYFVRWSKSGHASGPMGELTITDRCWR